MTSPNLTELANQFKSDKGTEYFEKHGYTLVYEELFSLIKSEPLVFLEIGLCIGGPEFGDEFLERVPADIPSIRMWSEYFENAHIYGFDINDFSFFEAAVENFKFIRGDLSLKQDIESLVKTTRQIEETEEKAIYDVIIDDASHASFHQQQALAILFPCGWIACPMMGVISYISAVLALQWDFILFLQLATVTVLAIFLAVPSLQPSNVCPAITYTSEGGVSGDTLSLLGSDVQQNEYWKVFCFVFLNFPLVYFFRREGIKNSTRYPFMIMYHGLKD